MYSNTHGCTGAIIYSACQNKLLGAFLTFLSHYFLDYLGETGYGGLKIELFIEGTFLAIFILLALLSNDPMPYFIGWAMGNGPDLIDKRLFINRHAKQYLSCHGFTGLAFGKIKLGLFSINNWRLGYPVKIKLNRKQTIASGVIASVTLLIFTLLKINGVF